MAKHQITTIDKEKIIERVNESAWVDDIAKSTFFKLMKNNGYDLDRLKQILEDNKISSTEQYNFNDVLRKIKNEHYISLSDCIIYLEEIFTKFKKILSVFDDDTKLILKKELSEKYHIPVDSNNLKQILKK